MGAAMGVEEKSWQVDKVRDKGFGGFLGFFLKHVSLRGSLSSLQWISSKI